MRFIRKWFLILLSDTVKQENSRGFGTEFFGSPSARLELPRSHLHGGI